MVRPLALGLLAALVLASPATAAETNYPSADGWTFTGDAQGFKDGGGSCALLNLLPDPTGLLCSVTNEFNGADGFQKGSLETAFDTLVNAQAVFTGLGTWSSPSFTLDPNQRVGSATIFVDRKAYVDELVLEQGSDTRSDVVLVDETDNKARTLLIRDDLGFADIDNWVRRTRAIGTDGLVPGHTYHIDLVSNMTSSVAQVIEGEVGIGYDNVRLLVMEPVKGDKGDSGTTGAQGAPGTTGPAGPAGPGTTEVLSGSGSGAGSGSGVPNSAAARKLLAILGLKTLHTRGGFADQMRVRIRCKTAVTKRCEGTVKIRSVGMIKSTLKGKPIKRRFTFGSGSYQLDKSRIGYAKAQLTPAYRKLLLKRKKLKVDALLTVLDETGHQQTLRRRFTLKTRR